MKIEVFQVAGMTSDKCVETITRALNGIAGVADIDVSLLRSQVAVQFDEKLATTPQLESALTKSGYAARAVKLAEADQGGCCGGCCH